MAKSAEESARYILKIFQAHNTRRGGTVLMNNLTLPFAQDGWTLDDLATVCPSASKRAGTRSPRTRNSSP